MKPVLVENSVLCRLCSICIILRTKVRVEIITCTIWVKPTGSCGVDFMRASCTARLALWKKKLLVFDFYLNWWLLKEQFFFALAKRELLSRSSSLTRDNYRQHTLQMTDVLGAFRRIHFLSPKPCDSVNQFVFGVGLRLVS